MQVYRSGARPVERAPEEGFVGDVYVGGYFKRDAPSRLAGATVTFTPGARTPWKTTPLGQTLLVTSGMGWAQGEGEEMVEVRAGDVIWCPPGRRHWEGATPHQSMTYVALHETEDGRSVGFGEKVTDEEYRRVPSGESSQR